MGIFYQAEQQSLKRLVALKVIRGGHFVDEQQIKLFEREAQALAIDRKRQGEVHPDVSSNLFNLGLLYLESGDLARAEDYSRQSNEMDNKFYGANNPRLADGLAQLGVILTKENKFAEAEATLRRAVSLAPPPSAPDCWRTALQKSHLCECLAAQKKFKDAEPLLVEGYSVVKEQFGPQHDQTREVGLPLIALYEGSGKKDETAAIRAELGIAK
jgi:tetratricopeptide (TPR) repeat protein